MTHDEQKRMLDFDAQVVELARTAALHCGRGYADAGDFRLVAKCAMRQLHRSVALLERLLDADKHDLVMSLDTEVRAFIAEVRGVS